jgi:cell division protein FtsI (penicillin-binding protein 3)
LICDTTKIFYPATKDGNLTDLTYLLENLEIPYKVNVQNEWGRSQVSKKDLVLNGQDLRSDIVPNVVGMGAKDAVFLLENRGLTVDLNGFGTVISQSISPGSNAKKGAKITLKLK